MSESSTAAFPDGLRVGVVVATRNRRAAVLHTLTRLRDLPERPPVVLVDNASSDGTAASARERHPEVRVLALTENVGAAARTAGARLLDTPLVAFSDDDSWWAPGALARAAAAFAAHPSVALVAARVLVGPDGRVDEVSRAMEKSPLGTAPGLPGPSVLGFVACGAVVRREPFLAVGGFERRFGVGGEEALLAIDLAARGHDLVYLSEVVAHHHPAEGGRPRRGHVESRNLLWSAWLRRPARAAVRKTLDHLRGAPRDRTRLAGAAAAVRGLPWVLTERRVVPPEVERSLRALEGSAPPLAGS